MNSGILGVGWVTPLGTDLETVWEQLAAGVVAEAKVVVNPESGRELRYFPIPPKLIEALGRNPRLRRSSAISYFSVAAGLAALENAGIAMTPAIAARTALVFAITDGGVLYTRKFYEQIVKQGAHAASPLLFPETVYNAPASHLAAQLGIDGASYTLVGDASVGLAALHFAGQLLSTNEELDQCVVVGAEECDWILCEAYRQWRLARTPLAEGAGALVLGRTGPWKVQTHPGATFLRQSDAQSALASVLTGLDLPEPPDLIVRSANGSFIDRAESAELDTFAPGVPALFPKRSLGEALGASALLQTITAVLALGKQGHRNALVPVIGFNQQASAAVVTAALAVQPNRSTANPRSL